MNLKLNYTLAKLMVFMAVCCVFTSNAAAATCSEASIEWVNKSYVAYYGRPADPGGLDYWACRLDAAGGDLSSIIDAFGVSEEFNIRYGSLSNDQLLDTIYQQMFNRDPDPGGKDWYLSKLESGEMNLQTITLFVLGGASGDDSTIINNKLHIASYFTESLRTAQRRYDSIDDARDIVNGVDATIGSRDFALSYCDSLIDSWPPQAGTPAYITVPTADSDGSYSVLWGSSATTGVTYELEEATDSTFTTGLRLAYNGTGQSAVINGRSLGTIYYYRVRAKKSSWTTSAWETGVNGCTVGDPILTIPTLPAFAKIISEGINKSFTISGWIQDSGPRMTITGSGKLVMGGASPVTFISGSLAGTHALESVSVITGSTTVQGRKTAVSSTATVYYDPNNYTTLVSNSGTQWIYYSPYTIPTTFKAGDTGNLGSGSDRQFLPTTTAEAYSVTKDTATSLLVTFITDTYIVGLGHDSQVRSIYRCDTLGNVSLVSMTTFNFYLGSVYETLTFTF